jgi:primase-polymerase (primpol)-like protein
MKPPDLRQVPAELRQIDRWLAWKSVPKAGGGFDKVPIGKDWNRPDKLKLPDDVKIVKKGGIGFYFTDADDIGGIDLDCCRDPETGAIIADWARDVLAAFPSDLR